MRISKAAEILLKELVPLFGEREAKSIARIFWEDLFHYKGGIDRMLHSKEVNVFESAMAKLVAGMPIQYVTGLAAFYNFLFEVNQAVLIPRPETEELVFQILQDGLDGKLRVLDIGTGSGCVPITLKKNKPEIEALGIDISEEALQVAKRNAERHECLLHFKKLNFLDSDQWAGLGRFDLVVSNPPYIDRSEKQVMSSSTLSYEPEIALFPNDSDVLVFYRKIAEFSKVHLKEGGRIYMECNEFNSEDVVLVFQEAGYPNTQMIQDLQGKDRIVRVLT